MDILIIDDEIQSLHDFLDNIISDNEYDINYKFFKDDLANILSYIKKHHINAAFIDINMPNINGIELAKRILEVSKETKILFITGLNIKLEDIDIENKENILGIIYKPVSRMALENYLVSLSDQDTILTVNMFNGFDCYINNRLVTFTSAKSKELFAYLLVNRYKSVTMEHAITILWPDKDIEKAKISYRDVVWRLRQTLKEINFPCINFSRALLTLDPTNIKCDFYDVIDKKCDYHHEPLLPSYDWSIDFETKLNY